MKKYFAIALIFINMFTVAKSQDTLESNLKKHVTFLASDEMYGRSIGSREEKLAAAYIKKQLQDMGLAVYDFTVSVDSLIHDSNKETDDNDYILDGTDNASDNDFKKTQHTRFYTIIPAESSVKKNEYIYLTSDFTGLGVDTIKNHIIIKNSANYNASSVSALLELVRMLSSDRNRLQRDIVVMFSAGWYKEDVCRYYAEHNNNKTFKLAFAFSDLGYLGYDDDENKYTYSVSADIQNVSSVLQPILMQNLDIPTFAEYDAYSSVPYIDVYGESLSPYKDVTDSIQFDNLKKITMQLRDVVTAFDTVYLKIRSSNTDKHNNKSLYSDNFPESLFIDKPKSYFGVNLMIGSNKHYYTKGTTTGKAAMSYSAGIFYKQQLSKSLSLRLDMNYERAYANRKDGRYSSDVLSIPLSLLRTVGNNDWELGYGLGMYYDYTLDAELDKAKINKQDYKDGEWGWQYSLFCRFGHFIMGYYQKIGITDMMTDSYPHSGKIKNRNMYFVLGWKF